MAQSWEAELECDPGPGPLDPSAWPPPLRCPEGMLQNRSMGVMPVLKCLCSLWLETEPDKNTDCWTKVPGWSH